MKLNVIKITFTILFLLSTVMVFFNWKTIQLFLTPSIKISDINSGKILNLDNVKVSAYVWNTCCECGEFPEICMCPRNIKISDINPDVCDADEKDSLTIFGIGEDEILKYKLQNGKKYIFLLKINNKKNFVEKVSIIDVL